MASMFFNWELINPDEVKDYVDQNGVSHIDEFLKTKLEQWREVEVNIAVTGEPGGGKSSFINAIRGLNDDDEGAAKVGVTETTLEPTCYDHPTNPKIKFWDLPGIGTENYPDLETYCKKVQLEKYGAFLLFVKDRFLDNDKKLAKKIRSIDKRFFFIRAKIDESVRAEKRKRSFNEDAMLEEIRSDCLKNLVDEKGNKLGNEQNIFLISNHYPAKWEFDRLTEAILDALPIYQRESLTLSLGILSTEFLQRKVQVLKRRLWIVALASAAAAMIPLPGVSIPVDLVLIKKEISFYKSQLGLPEEGSQRFAMLSVNTQKEVSAFCGTVSTVSQVGKLMAVYASEQAAEEAIRIIPFVGLLAAGAMSFATTYLFLKYYLKKMEKMAESVLKEAFQNLQFD